MQVASTVMRVTVFIATSLDGYIAREDGGLDWLPVSAEPHGYEELMASVDALVMGRKTFETVLGFGQWPYGSKPIVVLSSRELGATPEGAVLERMGGEPQEVVARLAERGMQHVYLDGGETIRRFLRAGLVDRMILTRVPVLLGSGVPLFGGTGGDIRWKHVGTRAFPSGLVQSEYEVARDVGQ